MIKYYCDRCGVEIKNGIIKPISHFYTILRSSDVPLFHADTFDDDACFDDRTKRLILCDCCSDLMDDFFNKKAIKGIE